MLYVFTKMSKISITVRSAAESILGGYVLCSRAWVIPCFEIVSLSSKFEHMRLFELFFSPIDIWIDAVFSLM